MKRLFLVFIMLPLSINALYGQEFSGVPLIPFGSGHRLLTEFIYKNSRSVSDIEIFVFYSRSRAELTSLVIGGALHHGKAVLEDQSDGKARYSFIFPHTDHPAPNHSSDRNIQIVASGRRTFYRVCKRVGGVTFFDPIRPFIMPDKLTIALLGDSYASGEGAPDDALDFDNSDMWANRTCHRSLNSGQVRAVKQLKAAHTGLAIAYKHRACSGAEIDDLFDHSQTTASGTVVLPQLQQIQSWLTENHYTRLDALVMSAGGNDAGLIRLVTDFLFTPFNDISTDAEAQDDLSDAINVLIPETYNQLNNFVRANFIVNQVLITEYPNPLNGPDGTCGGFGPLPLGYGLCWGPLETQNPKAEFRFARDSVMIPFNAQIQASARNLGWMYVGGGFVSSGNRGVCDCDGCSMGCHYHCAHRAITGEHFTRPLRVSNGCISHLFMEL